MKTKLFTVALLFAAIAVYGQESKSIYDYSAKTIDGRTFDMSSLKGKKVLIVNTASKCGFTPQYADLEKLYKKFGDKDFVVIGFPANNFANKEPGNDKEISEFCTTNYGITFPMMSKISVKGDDMDPIYKWLTEKKLNGKMDADVKWNFQKYLIDEKGNLVDTVNANVNPMSPEIVSWLEGKSAE